ASSRAPVLSRHNRSLRARDPDGILWRPGGIFLARTDPHVTRVGLAGLRLPEPDTPSSPACGCPAAGYLSSEPARQPTFASTGSVYRVRVAQTRSENAWNGFLK